MLTTRPNGKTSRASMYSNSHDSQTSPMHRTPMTLDCSILRASRPRRACTRQGRRQWKVDPGQETFVRSLAHGTDRQGELDTRASVCANGDTFATQAKSQLHPFGCVRENQSQHVTALRQHRVGRRQPRGPQPVATRLCGHQDRSLAAQATARV